MHVTSHMLSLVGGLRQTGKCQAVLLQFHNCSVMYNMRVNGVTPGFIPDVSVAVTFLISRESPEQVGLPAISNHQIKVSEEMYN